MQTRIHIHCHRGQSLREAIAKDRRLERHGLTVVRELKPGRSPGWMKVKALDRDRHGAINIEWDGEMMTLRCRVVTRGGGRPDRITGAFVEYLIAHHRRRIESILIRPG